MATRAAHSNSQQHRTPTSRAAHDSGHSSSSDTSLESGRQRRRRGKQKMQLRIDDLLAQNRCLRQLIDELLGRFVCQDKGPPAEIFDLFRDDAAVVSLEAAIQTDISVDWSRPDIFVTLPPATDGHATAQCTAHADAAAGHAPQSTRKELDVHAIDIQSRDLARTAVPLATVKEQSTANQFEDFNSHDLAFRSEPLPYLAGSQFAATHDQLRDFTSVSQDGNAEDFNSQNLALHSELLVDNQRQCHADADYKHLCTGASQEADVPLATGRRQALDDVNSEQRRASGKDIHSQDDPLGQSQLGQPKQCGPLPLGPALPGPALPGPPLPDFNSQDLAVSSGHLEVVTRNSEHCITQAADEPSTSIDQDFAISSGQHAFVTPCSEHCHVYMVDEPQRTQCGPLPRSAKDFISQDLACLDSTSLNHAPSDGNCIGATREDDVPLATGRRHALDDVNSEQRRASGIDIHSQFDPLVQSRLGQRTQCGPLPLDFNSQDLAFSSELLEVVTSCNEHCNTHAVGEPQQTQCGPTQSKSQDLASASRHLEAGTLGREQCQSHAVVGSPQTPCGPLPQIAKDSTSQDLACLDSQAQFEVVTPSREQCDTHAVAGPQHAQCGPLPLTAKDFTSQDLACISTGTRQALEDHHAEHRVASRSDFKEPSPEFHSKELAASSRAHAPTPEQVQDFEDTLQRIIDIFNKRRKISNNVLSSTARVIQSAASMRGVDISKYRDYIQSRSLRLYASIF